MIDEYALDDPADTAAIHDVALIESLVRQAACEGRALSYSELLAQLGLRFTRPKMRQVCRTLDAVDTRAAEAGEPELAVLVVRESDGLPGQGWWTGRTDYQGEWTGPEAQAHVRRLQEKVFAYWKHRAG